MTYNIEENAWLQGVGGVLSGKKLDLQKGETILGRGSVCQIQIKDPKVSRSHASIKVEVTGLTITDLSSASGTFVNGKRVMSQVLKDGDLIKLGDTTIEVSFKQDAIPTMLEPEPVAERPPFYHPPPPTPVVPPPISPPPISPPPVIPPPAMVMESETDSKVKPIVIGCGGLSVLALCAIGIFLIYTNLFAYEEPISEVDLAPEITFEDISGELDEPDLTPPSTETPIDTSDETSGIQPADEAAGENDEVKLVIRAYDDATDGDLFPLIGNAEWDKESSIPGYAYYSGTWNEGEAAVISSGWCADDKETLDENFPHIRFELVLDGIEIPVDNLTFALSEGEGIVCQDYKGVVEGLSAGEHILMDTWHFDMEVSDGQMMYGPGKETAEFDIQVIPRISIIDNFEEITGDWTETQQSNFNLTQGDSRFTIEIFKENFTAWSLYDNLVFEDATILTSAMRASEGEGAYGIVFRYQDVNNFYYFRLDYDGNFEIGKRVEGEFIPVSGPTRSEKILQYGEYNNLGLIVAGEIFHAYINSEEVATVIDNTFDKGQLGMMASTSARTTNFKAEFEQFSIDVEDDSR